MTEERQLCTPIHVGKSKRRWSPIGLFVCFSMAHLAYATSFDCAKAATKVEKLVCADAELSKLDEELNGAYKTALQDEKHAVSVRQTQKQWMKERNACSDAACVKRAYEERVQGFSSASEKATSIPRP